MQNNSFPFFSREEIIGGKLTFQQKELLQVFKNICKYAGDFIYNLYIFRWKLYLQFVYLQIEIASTIFICSDGNCIYNFYMFRWKLYLKFLNLQMEFVSTIFISSDGINNLICSDGFATAA